MDSVQTSIKRKGCFMKKKQPDNSININKSSVGKSVLLRKKYGTDKNKLPEGISKEDCVWIDNPHATNYGWVESDASFIKRIEDAYLPKNKQKEKKVDKKRVGKDK